MQKLLGALTAATLFIAAYGDAVAFPVAVLKASPGGDIVPVAQGCGPGGWRGPWGHCRYTPFSGRSPEAVMLQATTVARLALGVARGVTAATRRSTEGIRTDRGIRPHGHEDRPYLGGWARACAVCAAIEYVMAVEDAQDVSVARAYLENLLASPLLSP
jgi:hypothetical protein